MITGVSVIICCYNSEKTIGSVLRNLDCQIIDNQIAWEVIVVDNASTDRTEEIAKQSWKRNNIPFQIVYENEPGLSNARKRGLSLATYGYVVFVDDDNLLSENYISTAYQILQERPEVGLVGGNGKPVTSLTRPSWFSKFQSAYAVGEQSEHEGYLPMTKTYLYGAGLIMRKCVWDHLIERGFQFVLSGRKGKSLASGEDSELTSVFQMAGYKLWYDPRLQFEHLIPDQRVNWGYIRKLAREFGKSRVIINLYKAEILHYEKWKRIKTTNWSVATLIGVYHLLRLVPSFIRIRIAGKEGAQKEFDFLYQYGILHQYFAVFGHFRAIKKEISALYRNLNDLRN